jgi:hypothetical protein
MESLYDFGKRVKDRELTQRIDVSTRCGILKQSASELEDENRALREKLRFKSNQTSSEHISITTNQNLIKPGVPSILRERSGSGVCK